MRGSMKRIFFTDRIDNKSQMIPFIDEELYFQNNYISIETSSFYKGPHQYMIFKTRIVYFV